MYKNVRKQYHRWSFRLSVLGKPVDAGESYEDDISAGIAADLAKHHLAREFKLVLEPSLSGEMFSSLAYSRRGVDLSSSSSVEKALAPGVKAFIEANKSELEAHRDAQPAETTASKFRRSDVIKLPAVREWVESLEQAEDEARAFAAIDSASFFLRLKVVASSLTAALKSLHLTMKTHNSETCGTNPRLVQRRQKLAALVVHLSQNLEYVKDLSATLRAEQAEVESAVAALEANRPALQ